MKFSLSLLFIVCAAQFANAQNTFPLTGAAGIGTTTPNASALLEVKSTTKGFISRMTLIQRNAITSPAPGLLIYQTDNSPGFYFYNGSSWRAIASSGANTSLSNLDSVTSVNATLQPANSAAINIGTVNNHWNNVYANSIYANASYYAGSYKVLDVPGTNTFTGLTLNTSNIGYNNTFTGNVSGFQNTLGYDNTATGYSTLYNNTTGNNNTVTGDEAMNYNTTGSYNTVVGAKSMYSNSSGNYNAAMGYRSMYSNANGYYNTAIGYECLYGNIYANENTAIGYHSLYANTNSGQNVAVGNGALYTQSFANSNLRYVSKNTAVGYHALYVNQPNYASTGNNNTAVGWSSLPANTYGYGNTVIGSNSLSNITTGNYNTAIGEEAGNYANTAFCTFVGSGTYADDAYYDCTALGADVEITASQQVRIGDGSTFSIGGWANWTNISDGRVKKNIKQNVPGLAFINKLQPVTYNLNLDAADKITRHQRKDSTGKIISLSQIEVTARAAKEQTVYSGFIAQDVEKTAKSLNYNFSDVDAARNSKDLYGLRYAEFVVPLVQGEQELSKENDSLKLIVSSLQDQLNQLKAMIVSSPASNQSAIVSSATLQQNIPNPFSSSTTIGYNLPDSYSSAKIIVTDIKGSILKQINLATKGTGNVQLDVSTLASGAYQYSLYVNNRLIDTKQMISSK